MSAAGLWAQSSRMQVLEKACNLTISTTDDRTYHYLVSAEQSYTMHRLGDGRVTIARDTFHTSDIRGMRFVALPKFSLDEDSTAIGTNYSVDHGLLAFRRSFNLGRWNTIVVPFALTGSQVRDAFGKNAMLALARTVTEGDVATLEFDAISLDTDDVVMEAGIHYLIRPTREPDLPKGKLTTAAYGSGKVEGPLYVIPNVTMVSDKSTPANMALRSTDDNVRLRFRGSYVNIEDNAYTSSHQQFMLNDEGRFVTADNGVAFKAFRSWIEESRNNNELAFRFYINGVGEDITGTSSLRSILSDVAQPEAVYDLSGRRVSGSLKSGVYVINGKKFVAK